MVYPILAKVAARKSAREGHRVIVKVYVTYKLMLMQKLMPGTSPLSTQNPPLNFISKIKLKTYS